MEYRNWLQGKLSTPTFDVWKLLKDCTGDRAGRNEQLVLKDENPSVLLSGLEAANCLNDFFCEKNRQTETKNTCL